MKERPRIRKHASTAKPDLRQVAATLGVAISTVSRALNNAPDVAPATRERIQERARELSYAPNAAGRRLRLQRVDVVGFLLTPPQDRFADPIYLDLLNGIVEELAGAGLDLSIHLARSADDELRLLRKMVEGGSVDAVILPRTRPRDERIAWLDQREVRYATFGRTDLGHAYRHLDIDNRSTAFRATELLIEAGYERPALLVPQPDLTFVRHQREGYEAAMRKHGRARARTILTAAFPIDSAYAAARDALARDACDALVCASDAFAAGAYRAAAELGRRVGEDLGVTGYAANPMLASLSPPLTTFQAEMTAAGRRLARILMDDEPAGEVWQATLVPGRSHLRARDRRR